MKYQRIYIVLFCQLLLNTAAAQFQTLQQSSLKKIKIATRLPIQSIDPDGIMPGTASIPELPAAAYYFDEWNGKLYLLRRIEQDSITIIYRKWPQSWTKKKFHLSFDSIRNNFLAENIKPTRLATNASSPALFNFRGMQSEGSIGRTISIGNSQDAVLNSSLNLQLSGHITDSLELLAAITDNNIPIQPDGNTQDLRDFDRVLLQLRKSNWQISLGDIMLTADRNYFLRFNKRLQGLSFTSKENRGGKWMNELTLSGAVAKGKFFRNTITPLEGNQGPYRLKGAANELYFVVLAGSERVFIDGILMQRGEDQDYVINYNTAEITFTPKQLISKDKRIQVEFEYADRNYLNTQIYFDDRLKLNNGYAVSLSAFINADAKNTTIDQPLNASQKYLLGQAGDSIQNAYYETAVRDTFAPGKILYRKIDTTYNGFMHDSVFVLATQPSQVLYSVSFSYVGSGKGNYRQLLNSNNGKVFQWVPPGNNGTKNGDYSPVALLVSPKSLQLYSMQLEAPVNRKNQLKAELALSNYNINLFSFSPMSQTTGLAGKLKWQHQTDSFRLWKVPASFQLTAEGEWVQQQFKTQERLRNVEFARDWGIDPALASSDERLTQATAVVSMINGTHFQYQFAHYHRKDGYNGFRNSATVQIKTFKGWSFQSATSWLKYTQTQANGSFLRPTVDIKKEFIKWKKIRAGFNFTGEYNQLLNKLADTLFVGSFGFSRYEWSIQSAEAAKQKWGITYFTREDKLPTKNLLIKYSVSNNYEVKWEGLNNANRQLILSAGYRKMNYFGPLAIGKKADETLISRIEYGFNEFKGMLSGNLFYEIGGGQEQKRNFAYLQVPAGTGQYTWIDYNQNSIEELNEFELAVFQDQKKYIRIFSPTNELVKSRFVQFNANGNFDPSKKILHPNNKLQRLLTKTTLNASVQINRKQLSDNQFVFNPFDRTLDSSVVAESRSVNATLFYNRTGKKWGLDVTRSSAVARALLTYGFETKALEQWLAKFRCNIGKQYIFQVTLRDIENSLGTTGNNFSNRNYNILQKNIEPAITWLKSNRWRATVTAIYSQKRNQADTGLSAISQKLDIDIKYNGKNNSSLQLKGAFDHIRINDTGFNALNSPAGFIMLDGLSKGNNLLWGVDYTKRLSGNLELSLQYEGRKPGMSREIHTGRASVRAVF